MRGGVRGVLAWWWIGVLAVVFVAHGSLAQADDGSGGGEGVGGEHRGEAGAVSMVPDRAAGVVSVRSIEGLNAASADLLQAAGLVELPTLGQALRVLGLRDGLAVEGDAAIGVWLGDGGDWDAAAVIPTDSFDALASALGASPADDGGVRGLSFEGVDLVMRHLGGGYAGLATGRGALGALGDGAGGSWAAALAEAGATADRAEVLIGADAGAVRSWVGSRFEGSLMRASIAAVSDAERVLGGIRVTPRGLIGRFAVAARPGSALAAPAQGDGEGPGAGDGLLAGVPARGWLGAMGVDGSHPAAAAVLGRVGLDLPGLGVVSAGVFVDGGTDGAGLIEGLVRWGGGLSGDASRAREAFWERSDGWAVDLVRREAEGRIGGAPAERWAARSPIFSGGPAARVIGASGGEVEGVAAVVDESGIAATDPALAIRAASRDIGAVDGERMVRATRRILAPDRFAEVQLNGGAMVELLSPLAAARGVRLENPRRYPPLAASLSASDGELRAILFVPAAMLQNVFALREEIAASLGVEVPLAGPGVTR